MIPKLLIGITFHFVEERIKYLKKIGTFFPELSKNTKVFVVTNSESLSDHNKIKLALGSNIEIYVPKYLGHPHLLTWSHFDIFRTYFNTDPNITHFMYLEDDILVKPNNITYWLRGREHLRKIGLIPSFIRYEIADGETQRRCTDIQVSMPLQGVPKVTFQKSNYCYINLPNPYQGMYLLDRELAEEHLFGPSTANINLHTKLGIREKAAMGLAFTKVPQTCRSRYFVGFFLDKKLLDTDTLIHHTPNNYANDPRSPMGKLTIEKLTF